VQERGPSSLRNYLMRPAYGMSLRLVGIPHLMDLHAVRGLFYIPVLRDTFSSSSPAT
jgi:hypothetical protein